ncbi:MAG: T9SS type A sorting domain-containing protein, partial [Bacteroidetes bacterium]|nr:T9SS type A sorting domain-containing protein [Bacteroidota bacterium]
VQDWLAQDRFIVKSRQEPLYVDSLGLNIPGQIAELEEFRPPSTSVDYNIIISGFKLYQNYPNPFNPATIIEFHIPYSAFCTLKVYDLLGREVATLVDKIKEPGVYHFPFSIYHFPLPSGVYFYQLRAGSYVETKKMQVIK